MISRFNYEGLELPDLITPSQSRRGPYQMNSRRIRGCFAQYLGKIIFKRSSSLLLTMHCFPKKDGVPSGQMNELSDEDLLIKLSEGERKALDILYLRHSGRVLSYALKRRLPQERAEDLLQIVFLQLYRKKHLYAPKHSALAWLYVITRSELKDYRNREIKDFLEWEESLSQTAAPSPNIEDSQEAAALLKDLKPREQEVMKLRYLDEMEYDEIAALLKESESNVRQIVSRSLKFLRGHKVKGASK